MHAEVFTLLVEIKMGTRMSFAKNLNALPRLFGRRNKAVHYGPLNDHTIIQCENCPTLRVKKRVKHKVSKKMFKDYIFRLTVPA